MNVLLRFLASGILLALISSSFSLTVFAQTQTSGGTVGGQTSGGTVGSEGNTGLVNPLNGVNSLPEFLRAILGGIVEIGTIILIMMLVYVGFLFVAARGNAEKLQSAKSALVWTVIGGLILLGATAIQLVIEETVKSLS